MTDVITVAKKIQYILNDNMADPLPSGSRVGSKVFGMGEEINFGKFMPKFQISYGETSTEIVSHNRKPSRLKMPIINVFMYVPKGYQGFGGSNLYKDKELIEYYFDEIEDVLYSNAGSLPTNSTISGFGRVDNIIWNREGTILTGIKPIIMKIYKSGEDTGGH